MLTIAPSQKDIDQGLASWDWLDFEGMNPFLVSCFGDVFFESPKGIHLLDTIAGQLKRVAENRRDLQDKLSTEEGQEDFLLAGLANAAREQFGLVLEPGECYDFKVPPVLSGPMSAENIEKTGFVLKLNLCGQIHKQVKDLPPGTKVKSFKTSEA